MDIAVKLINLEAQADANFKNNMALVAKLDGHESRVEIVERNADRNDREVPNLREQMNLLSGQVTALQLALAESRSYNGSAI